jgi:hypothetical protein
MLRRVALVTTDVSEELSASFTGGQESVNEALSSSERRFLQEPHGLIS